MITSKPMVTALKQLNHKLQLGNSHTVSYSLVTLGSNSTVMPIASYGLVTDGYNLITLVVFNPLLATPMVTALLHR